VMAFSARSCDERFLSDSLHQPKSTRHNFTTTREKKKRSDFSVSQSDVEELGQKCARKRIQKMQTHVRSALLAESGPSRSDIEEMQGHQQHQSFKSMMTGLKELNN